nr:hypothetical protein [Lacticaseibacillus manihotivorans]
MNDRTKSTKPLAKRQTKISLKLRTLIQPF